MTLEIWVEYLLRFSHLVAGIAWIGSSFYFIWMDSSFEPPETPRKNVEGEVFMVHGGFYYQVEKRKIFPGELPKVLHWFKWEATLTWITGFLLFIVLYYLNGASLLIDPSLKAWTHTQAIVVSLAIMVASWFIYDFIWHPTLMEKSKKLSTVLSVIFFAGLIFGLCRIFSGRGAYILAGAIMGSMMLLNVWVRILPGQAKMLKDAQAGNIPDYSVSLKSKTRSVHNTYFIFPVLFIMLSNHYPILYNHNWNWLLLIILGVSGALVRHAMVTKNSVERWTLLPACIGLFTLIFITGFKPATVATQQSVMIPYSRIQQIVEQRCLQCHSSNNTDDVYKVAPKGTLLETEEQFRALAEKINLHVVLAKSMPLGNKTQMMDSERLTINVWLQQQGLIKNSP